MIHQRYLRPLLFFTLLVLLVSNTTPAFACTQLPPAFWFDESVNVVSSNLPDTVQLSTLQDGSIALQDTADSTIYMKDEHGKAQKIAQSNLVIRVDPGYFDAVDENLVIEGDIQKSIALKTYNVIQDNRPTNVAIPQPQNVAVEIQIGQQTYVLQLRVSYQLNPYYRPDSLDMYRNGCSRFGLMLDPFTLIFGLFIAILIVAAIVAIFSILKNNKKENQ